MSDHDHTLAAPYALNALEPAERQAFEQHLATCDECANDVREMRQTLTRFAMADAAKPPDSLRDQILARAGQTPQDAADSPVVPLRRAIASPTNRWLAGIAAAALLVAGALGVSTHQANQRADELQASTRQVNQILADPDTVLATGEVAGGGTGTFVVSRELKQGVLVTGDVPEVSADQTYQLWAINDEGARSVGLYSAGPSGNGTALVDFPDTATTFGMTVEPSGGSEQPTTDPVLLLPVKA